MNHLLVKGHPNNYNNHLAQGESYNEVSLYYIIVILFHVLYTCDREHVSQNLNTLERRLPICVLCLNQL